MAGTCHGEASKTNNDFMEMDSICCSSDMADCINVKPATFITGPEAWPAHLQLKVRKKSSYFLYRFFQTGVHEPSGLHFNFLCSKMKQ